MMKVVKNDNEKHKRLKGKRFQARHTYILGEVEQWMSLVGETDDLVWLAIQCSAYSTGLDIRPVVEIQCEHLLSSLTYKVKIVVFAIDAFAVWKVLLG